MRICFARHFASRKDPRLERTKGKRQRQRQRQRQRLSDMRIIARCARIIARCARIIARCARIIARCARIIARCALICGAQGCEDIPPLGQAKEPGLPERLGVRLPDGIAPPDTVHRLLARWQPEALRPCQEQ